MGEAAGHPFRGNQWTAGQRRAMDRMHDAAKAEGFDRTLARREAILGRMQDAARREDEKRQALEAEAEASFGDQMDSEEADALRKIAVHKAEDLPVYDQAEKGIGDVPAHDDPTGQFTASGKKMLEVAEQEISAIQTFERAYILGPNGEHRLDKTGGKDYVSFGPQETRLMFGAVLTHNHPSSGPLSIDDMRLATQKGLREIRAVGSDGRSSYRFGIRKIDSRPSALPWPQEVKDYLEETFAKETLTMRLRIAAGEVTSAQANEAFSSQMRLVGAKVAAKYAHLGVYYKATKTKRSKS